MKKGGVWLVDHPTCQFKEDVKQLAAENELQVIDKSKADLIDSSFIAKEVPKLTKKKARK